MLEAFYVDNPQAHLSLFPFAPIPIIAKLGWLLSDKKSVDIYQKTRQPDTWSWMTTECTNDFEILIDRITPDERVDRVAIVISLSGDIALGRTIVPWTIEWLFYYEIWLGIGEWCGGGHSLSRKEGRFYELYNHSNILSQYKSIKQNKASIL